jgi:peroxiredoxin
MQRCTFLALIFSASISFGQTVEAPREVSAENPQEVDKTTTSDDKDSDAVKSAEGEKDSVLAGHSNHGEVFNEGARQRAYLMEGVGNIDFGATAKGDAKKFIDQGLGQMHGFWYFESERSFRQAAAIDPDCATAYWGMAYSNLGNEKRAKGFIKEAMSRKEKVSDRERMYIDALNAYINVDSKKRKDRGTTYVRALERILYKYPDDVEARSLLALHLWKNRSQVKTSHLAIDAVMQQVFEKAPMHPTHHYRIHLWDYERPQIAVSSAAKSGQSAPAIAHMWHMGGHIFSRLKRYNDAVWQQEASARVDHAHMMRDGVLPDRIHNFAHNNEWLIRNLNYVGRVEHAVRLAENMIELPRHPKYNTIDRRGSTMYGRTRLFETLRRYELWAMLVDYCETPYLEPTKKATEQDKRLRYLATAYYRLGDLTKGDALKSELQSRLKDQREKQETAIEAAKKKSLDAAKAKKPGEEPDAKAKKAAETAGKNAGKAFDRRIRDLGSAVDALDGHHAWANDEFATAYEKLKKAGGEDAAQLAVVQFLAGKQDEAITSLSKQVDRRGNESQPMACLIDLLWRAGKKEEAKKRFDSLRTVAGYADLKATPVFKRLVKIAEALEYPSDWRTPAPLQDDIGNRVDLSSLGPFRWSPSPAPEWTLDDVQGNAHTLKEYQGKPVVVIFYLGYGCLHCVEQLHAFAPKIHEFNKAGINVVGISSDEEDGLKKSIDDYDEGKLPIPLLADPTLEAFKRYRCFDDFEDLPLHGTFIISGEGKVLWRDISYEPFMDPDFVLTEAKRLLGQKKRVITTEGELPKAVSSE